MGIDLTLKVIQYESQSPWLTHNNVYLDRDYGIQEAVQKLDAFPVPRGAVLHYTDDGLHERATDPYGDPLRFMHACQLAKLALPADASEWNKAAFAWIKALPETTPIVLWWH